MKVLPGKNFQVPSFQKRMITLRTLAVTVEVKYLHDTRITINLKNPSTQSITNKATININLIQMYYENKKSIKSNVIGNPQQMLTCRYPIAS